MIFSVLIVCSNLLIIAQCKKWINPATNSSTIRFECRDESYPFNETQNGIFSLIYWRLPDSLGNILLTPGQRVLKAEVESNYDLIMHKEYATDEATFNGQYICAGLGPVQNSTNPNESVWYYLKWGYGIYDHPVMKEGQALERYHNKFLTGGLALLVYVCLVLGFKLTIDCSIKRFPEKISEELPESNSQVSFSKNTDTVTFYSQNGMITRL